MENNNNLQTNPKDLANWLKYEVNENDTNFDKIVELYDIIHNELNKENIYISVEENIFMIKLCNFIYKNSH
jgi:hypothetical protein